MKAEFTTVEVAPAVPAVTEDRVVLELSLHEARVLRAVFGKATPPGNNPIEFLRALCELFPEDYAIFYAGIESVTIKGESLCAPTTTCIKV